VPKSSTASRTPMALELIKRAGSGLSMSHEKFLLVRVGDIWDQAGILQGALMPSRNGSLRNSSDEMFDLRRLVRPASSHSPRLPARLAEHPLADCYNHAGVFGDRQEMDRKKQPTLWMLPAYEPSTLVIAPVLRFYHWLVMQQQLLAVKSISQPPPAIDARRPGDPCWSKELVVVRPIFLA